jgi:hypothetical protein
VLDGGSGLNRAAARRSARELDRVVVLPEPGNAGGRKGPDFCALAYNLGNFMLTLAMPAEWSRGR